MTWFLGMCVVILLTGIEFDKFLKHRQRFRLFIFIPLVFFILIGTPIAHHMSGGMDILLRITGIVSVLTYFWNVRRTRS